MNDKEYMHQIRVRDEYIDSLFKVLIAMKETKSPRLMELLDRTVRDRNRLDMQLSLLQHQFDILLKDHMKCVESTKHFKA